MEWYIVYRYYFGPSGASLWEVIDGVYCTHADQAVRETLRRIAVCKRDSVRAFRCMSKREEKIARRMAEVNEAFNEQWTRAEFVEFMQMPVYEGSRK